MKPYKLFLFTFFLTLAALLCSRQLKASAAERVPYTEADAIALAKMTWGEAGAVKDQTLPNGRVISSTAQKAAVMWTALNPYDAGIADSLLGVITKPNSFYGYDPAHPVQEDLLALAYDVLDRWEREKLGETDVGRVLPADYIYFTGDGKYNYFRNEFKTDVFYDWQLEDIYSPKRSEKIGKQTHSRRISSAAIPSVRS